MKREKWLLTLAAVFIGIATLGFLILQNPRLENKIRDKREDGARLKAIQQNVMICMEKANSFGDLAKLTEADRDVLKELNASNDILKKYENNRISFYRQSVLYTINAIEKWDEKQREEKVKEIDTLTVSQLYDKYVEYMEIAAENTFALQKRIDDNETDILSLEKNKTLWWYIYFVFQSLGLIFGLFAVVSKKVE